MLFSYLWRLAVPYNIFALFLLTVFSNGFAYAVTPNNGVVVWGYTPNGQKDVPVAAQSGVKAIAVGYSHCLALKYDGTVVGWGKNDVNQATLPSGIVGVVAIAAGRDVSAVLRNDGTVVAWGQNGSGQCDVPPNLNNVVAISLGGSFGLALKGDGTVVGWGNNSVNQIDIPPGLNNVVSISAGYVTSIAVKSDGTIVEWGSGSNAATDVPAAAQTGVTSVSSGFIYNLALKTNGSVVGWGKNEMGQATPPATASSDVIAVAAGDHRSIALKNDSTVVEWGDVNPAMPAQYQGCVRTIACGQDVCMAIISPRQRLHDATFRFTQGQGIFGARVAGFDLSSDPLTYTYTGTLPAGISLSSAGVFEGTPKSLTDGTPITVTLSDSSGTRSATITIVVEVAKPSGGVVVWGDDLNGTTVVPTTAQKDVIAIAGNAYHDLALKKDGTVVAWGADFAGQTEVPVGLAGVNAIAANYYQSMALKSDGSVVQWGAKDLFWKEVPFEAQSNIVAISAGCYHSLALTSSGRVIAWGQLDVPSQAQSGIVAISSGGNHAMALKNDGGVIVWGNSSFGLTTVPAAATSGVISIAAGSNHCVALKSDGSVIAWGLNNNGQTDVPAAARSGVVAIASSYNSCLALKANGSIISWGDNYHGQLNVPPSIQGGVLTMAVGGASAMALYNTPSTSPVNLSLSPSSVITTVGTNRTLTAVYSDVNGVADIKTAYLQVRDTLGGANSLFATYDAVANKLYLQNDSNTAALGGFAPGSNHTISNSQGSLNCAATKVSKQGNILTVDWNFTTGNAFTGLKNVYLFVRDKSNASDGFDDMGDWLIKGASNTAPVNVSVSPSVLSSNAGVAKSLSAVYSDAESYLDLKQAFVLVRSSVGGAGALFGTYDAATNKLYLQNDANTVALGGFAPGSNHIISNAQGSLDCANTTVVRSGNTVTINWNFTPSGSFTGLKNVYLFSRDTANASDGYDDLGDWSIGSGSGALLSPVPSGGTG